MGRKESNQTNKMKPCIQKWPSYVVPHICMYSKTCVKWSLSKRPKNCFQGQLLLNAGQKYCRMLNGSILQYFRPSLSYHLSWTSLFWLFLSGPFTQGWLYNVLSDFCWLEFFSLRISVPRLVSKPPSLFCLFSWFSLQSQQCHSLPFQSVSLYLQQKWFLGILIFLV